MTALDRRAALALIGAGLSGACARPPKPGRVAEAPEPGPKGGTGSTGIVGTLTDFGSLMVNALKIETGAETRFTNAFGEMLPSTLAIGDSLTIEAARDGGKLRARRVHLTHPVIGTIDEVTPNRRRMVVLGVDVMLAAGLPFSIGPGNSVAVSGLWRGNRVVASRIAPFPGRPVLAGTVHDDEKGRLVLGSLRLRLAKGMVEPESGSFVTLHGQRRRREFLVERLETGRFTGAAGPLRQLSVEGYLDPIDRAPGFEVSGLGHGFDPGARLEPFRDTRTLFTGPYDGDFRVETGVPLTEDIQRRRALLRRAARQGFGQRALLTR